MSTLDQQFDALGVRVEHHLVGGIYAKETHIPAGVKLTQHAHNFAHLSALMKGSALVEVDGVAAVHHAPALLTIKAHAKHAVTAVSDVVWACLHATDETDIDIIDEGLIE